MTEANQFREYAEEAIGWSCSAKTESEKRTLIRLACTWALAATYSERTLIPPPELRAAA